MRDYLSTFFVKYGYEEKDRAHLLKAYEKITENAEACKIWQGALDAYEADYNLDYNKEIIAAADKAAELTDVHPYTAELLIFLCMTRHLKKLYKQRGLCEEIYDCTVSDLKNKLNECKEVKGVCGSFVAFWFDGFFNLKRFGLGRLQFELINALCDCEIDDIQIKGGESRLINVHIPGTGEPLDRESCESAYALAREFFKDEIDGTPVFCCYSWLLFPDNDKVLPATSNVMRFAAEYKVVKWHRDCGDDLWRIFGTDEVNPERLVAKTSMQKSIKEYLLAGGRLGVAWGIKI